MIELPISLLVAEAERGRLRDLDPLYQSIKIDGLVEPLEVKPIAPTAFMVKDGARRLACLLALLCAREIVFDRRVMAQRPAEQAFQTVPVKIRK